MISGDSAELRDLAIGSFSLEMYESLSSKQKAALILCLFQIRNPPALALVASLPIYGGDFAELLPDMSPGDFLAAVETISLQDTSRVLERDALLLGLIQALDMNQELRETLMVALLDAITTVASMPSVSFQGAEDVIGLSVLIQQLSCSCPFTRMAAVRTIAALAAISVPFNSSLLVENVKNSFVNVTNAHSVGVLQQTIQVVVPLLIERFSIESNELTCLLQAFVDYYDEFPTQHRQTLLLALLRVLTPAFLPRFLVAMCERKTAMEDDAAFYVQGSSPVGYWADQNIWFASDCLERFVRC
jgi:hypothetical protein